MQNTIFITGSNRGIGFEFAKQYAQAKWKVIATCRSPEKASDLKKLQQNYPDYIAIFPLDVTDHKQIKAVAKQLQNQPIDILLNSAGVFGPSGIELEHIKQTDWQSVLDVNMIAPLLINQTLIENVRNSEKKILAAISSSMGSISENTSGRRYYYRSSKCGLNMVYKSLSIDLADQNIICVLLHPGWVKTGIGGPEAPLSAEESVYGLRIFLDKVSMEESGNFYNYKGEIIKW